MAVWLGDISAATSEGNSFSILGPHDKRWVRLCALRIMQGRPLAAQSKGRPGCSIAFEHEQMLHAATRGTLRAGTAGSMTQIAPEKAQTVCLPPTLPAARLRGYAPFSRACSAISSSVVVHRQVVR